MSIYTGMQRGALKKANSTLLNFWCPRTLLPCLNRGVVVTDTDKSKFIRQAIREKLERHGVVIPVKLKEAA